MGTQTRRKLTALELRVITDSMRQNIQSIIRRGLGDKEVVMEEQENRTIIDVELNLRVIIPIAGDPELQPSS